ncbi:MarR family winged helix-turn-helix transcriptional regulator [Streptomyces albus]|uniref:MarR family winged helix-turn-helix transcriptional regulator n=1 Tax=Streptomyces albus TaxID=1888 RepID=UPI0006E2DBA9|nr:MarR family transcriptional regulator [Streptomyces albus]
MREAGNRKTGSAPDLSAAPGVEELAQAADRLFYAMRRSRSATVGQSAAGLSMAQLALLAPLAEDADGEGLPVGRLAAHAEVSVPTATRMLKQLENKSVVTRRRSPHDERQVLIRLTREGAEHLAAMQAQLRARQYTALSQFTPQERHALAAQLHRLAGLINQTTPPSARPAAPES